MLPVGPSAWGGFDAQGGDPSSGHTPVLPSAAAELAAPKPIAPLFTGASPLGAVAKDRNFDSQIYQSLLDIIGAGEDDLVQDVANIPENAFVSSLTTSGLPLVMQGKVIGLYKYLAAVAEGEKLPASTSDSAPAGKSNTIYVAKEDPTQRKLLEVTDPLSRDYYDVISETVLTTLFLNWTRVMGGGESCPAAAMPTSDQLMAIYTIMKSHPVGRRLMFYVDFAIFGPYGRHTKELRMNNLSYWRPDMGGWAQKALPGPANLKEWLAAWAVFAAACIMVGAASPGALNAYAGGIETIMNLFGNHAASWGTVFMADKVMRAERWEQWLRQLYATNPPGFDPNTPLDFMLIYSSYNSPQPPAAPGHHKDWWYRCIDLPLRQAGPIPGDNIRPMSIDIKRAAERPAQEPNCDQPLQPNFGNASAGPKVACSHCGGPHRSNKCRQRNQAGKGKNQQGKGQHMLPVAAPSESSKGAGRAASGKKRARKGGKPK